VAEPLGSRFAKLWTASTTSALGSGLGHDRGSALRGGAHQEPADRVGHVRRGVAALAAAIHVSASTWRVFNRAAVAEAYAEPALAARPAAGLRCGYRREAPVIPEPGAQAAAAGLRASRADRERVIDLLKAAFVQDRLARDEFDTRIGQALASRTYAELAAVTADLPAELIAAPPRRPPARARRRLTMNTAVTGGAGVVVAANVGMMAALLARSAVAVVVVAVFTVIGMVVTIGAMIVAP
jgi:hypothetical protein